MIAASQAYLRGGAREHRGVTTRHPMSNVSQILSEGPEGLATLANRLPSSRRAGSLTPQALWRWATRGIRLPNGRVVRLETVRVAGRFLDRVLSQSSLG